MPKRRIFLSIVAIAGMLGSGDGGQDLVEIRVPIGATRDIDLADLVERLGRSTGVAIMRPRISVRIPIVGLGGDLSRRMLGEILGPNATLAIRENSLVVTLSPSKLAGDRSVAWRASLRRLVEHIDHEARNRADYGMHALKTYRPNDPKRPTVCLVHGLNSSSGGFVYLVKPLEDAGYGVVVYDYPYNRSLEESCVSFARDWAAFRKKEGETRPWAIVAHSMGALLARSYVEDPRAYGNDVSALLMVAPVNQGSSLAKAQTLLQLMKSVHLRVRDRLRRRRRAPIQEPRDRASLPGPVPTRRRDPRRAGQRRTHVLPRPRQLDPPHRLARPRPPHLLRLQPIPHQARPRRRQLHPFEITHPGQATNEARDPLSTTGRGPLV
ncbi:alpha/beta hydrolase [Singulisphaera rosea]